MREGSQRGSDSRVVVASVTAGPRQIREGFEATLSHGRDQDATFEGMELMTLFRSRFSSWMDASGFTAMAGGPAIVEAGFDQLQAGVMPILGELLEAEGSKIGLAEAVLDTARYPHLARLHGILGDLLEADVPAELLTWLARLPSLVPLLDADSLTPVITKYAFRSTSPVDRSLGKLLFFELLCFSERLLLCGSRLRLEAVGGDGRDIEKIAEEELAKALENSAYGAELRALEDPDSPIRVLVAQVSAALTNHVDDLKRELGFISQDIKDALDRRAEFVARLDQMDPADAVLLRNMGAEIMGEERLTIDQLRRQHPLMLDDVSNAAARKRLERIRKRLERTGALEPEGDQRRRRTLGVFLLEALERNEQ